MYANLWTNLRKKERWGKWHEKNVYCVHYAESQLTVHPFVFMKLMVMTKILKTQTHLIFITIHLGLPRGRRRSAARGAATAYREKINKKLTRLGYGESATPEEKAPVVPKPRRRYTFASPSWNRSTASCDVLLPTETHAKSRNFRYLPRKQRKIRLPTYHNGISQHSNLWNTSSWNCWIIRTTTTAAWRQSERACRLQFTDNKPFRLLKQFSFQISSNFWGALQFSFVLAFFRF